MKTSHMNASIALTKLLELAKQQEKKYAENGRSKRTEEHRLLSEADAERLREARVKVFKEKVIKAVDLRDFGTSALTYSEKDTVAAMTGRSWNNRKSKQFSGLASNPYGRKVFFDEVYRRLKAIHAAPDRTMHYITIVDDKWCLPERATSFGASSMMLRAKRALRNIGYHGILILEIQAVICLREGRFMPHLHGLIWRKGKEGTRPREAVERLRKRFKGIRKAKGVVISPVPQRLPKSLTTRFFYSTKLPDTMKRFCPVKGSETAFVSDPPGTLRTASMGDYSNLDALRIAGMLAQYQIDETVFAVGEGTKVRKAASKALSAKIASLKRPPPDPSPRAVLSVITKLLWE